MILKNVEEYKYAYDKSLIVGQMSFPPLVLSISAQKIAALAYP